MVPVNFRMPAKMKAALDALGAETGLTTSEIARICIERVLPDLGPELRRNIPVERSEADGSSADSARAESAGASVHELRPNGSDYTVVVSMTPEQEEKWRRGWEVEIGAGVSPSGPLIRSHLEVLPPVAA